MTIDWMETEFISWRDENGFLCSPPTAKLYDQNNDLLGEVFVSVASYMGAAQLTICLREVIKSEQYTTNVDYVELCGYKFQREFIEDTKHFDDTDLEYIIKKLYNL